jgi:hypothetical protein
VQFYFRTRRPESSVLQENSDAFKVHPFKAALHPGQGILSAENPKIKMLLLISILTAMMNRETGSE